MKHRTSVFIVGMLVLLANLPAAAGHRRGHGSIRHSDRYNKYRYEIDVEYRNRDALQLQREAIAAQEEAKREEGRRIRRDEIEKAAKERQKEYREFQKAILSASWAAGRAPRNFYYRRPGWKVSDMPSGHQRVDVAGKTYLHHSGVFYTATVSGYVVVTAPTGAVVPELPEGNLPVAINEDSYYYYFGTFYEESPRGYVVVTPPPGTMVPYLPDGYQTEHDEGRVQYRFGGISYRPVYREGILVFTVTEG